LRCQPWGTSGIDNVPQRAPSNARWYLPWRFAKWRGVNASWYGPRAPRARRGNSTRMFCVREKACTRRSNPITIAGIPIWSRWCFCSSRRGGPLVQIRTASAKPDGLDRAEPRRSMVKRSRPLDVE